MDICGTCGGSNFCFVWSDPTLWSSFFNIRIFTGWTEFYFSIWSNQAWHFEGVSRETETENSLSDSCDDNSFWVDSVGNACDYYQTFGCEQYSGILEEIHFFCPYTCGLCIPEPVQSCQSLILSCRNNETFIDVYGATCTDYEANPFWCNSAEEYALDSSDASTECCICQEFAFCIVDEFDACVDADEYCSKNFGPSVYDHANNDCDCVNANTWDHSTGIFYFLLLYYVYM